MGDGVLQQQLVRVSKRIREAQHFGQVAMQQLPELEKALADICEDEKFAENYISIPPFLKQVNKCYTSYLCVLL